MKSELKFLGRVDLVMTYVIVLEKRSNFAPDINFELREQLNRAVSELYIALSSIKNGQS